MFKQYLIDQIASINNKIMGVGQNGLLAGNIDAFNAILYGFVKTIMRSVVMPIAYVVLALFFALELHKVNQKMAGDQGAGYGVRLIFGVTIRIALAKIAVDSSLLIMEAIYAISQSITHGVSGVLASGAVAGGLDMAAVTTEINALGFGAQLGMLLQVGVVGLAVSIIVGLVQVICIGRFVEIYIYIALAPIPLATFPSEELSSVGKNFLKSFAAVCIQGTIIYIALCFFPVLFNANVLGTGATDVIGMLLYALVLAMTVFAAGRLAKSICNAM